MGWHAVLALFVFVSLVEGFSMSHILAFAPLYLQELGVSAEDVPKWVGLLSAASFIIGLPLVPFWGVWAEKYGRKVVIARSAYVEALVLLLVALSRTPIELIASRLLSGFQLGNTGVMYAALAAVVPRERLGLALGLMGAGATLGAAGGPTIGGLMADSFGLRTVYLFDAALSLMAGLAVTFLFREAAREKVVTGSAWRMAWDAISGIGRVPVVRRVFLAYVMMFVARQMVTPFLPLRVQQLYVGDALATTIGLVIGAGAVAGAMIAPSAGAVGDRVGYPSVLRWAAVIAAAGAIGLGLAPSLLMLALAVLVFSGGVTAVNSMCVALLATVTPESRRSSTLNLALLPLYIGAIVGPMLGATLATLGIRLTFVFAAVPLGLCWGLSRGLPRSSRGSGLPVSSPR